MKDIKKYWFISEYYWPVENATGHILTRLIDAFTQKHEAYIITVGNQNVGERNKHTHTVRIKDYSSLNKNNLIQRIIKLMGLSIKMVWAVLRNVKRNDIVTTVTNPALILIFLSCVKLFKKFKLIVLVHDVFPENLVVARIIKSNSLLYKIVKVIFNFAYNRADLLIVCGRDMQTTIREKVKDKNKVIFIPNFGDTDVLYPMPKDQNPILQNLNITDKLVILFTGNIGRIQDIDNIVKTAELLSNDSSIVFLFIGTGACLDKIQNYTEKNIIWLPNMDRTESQNFLNAGDIGLSTLLPNMMGTGVPSKTYSYMATGKPIIAVMDNDTEIALMIQEEGNGWVVEPDNPAQLAALLQQLKLKTDSIKEKGQISFNLSKTKYSIEQIINQYIYTIKALQ